MCLCVRARVRACVRACTHDIHVLIRRPEANLECYSSGDIHPVIFKIILYCFLCIGLGMYKSEQVCMEMCIIRSPELELDSQELQALWGTQSTPVTQRTLKCSESLPEI